MKYACGGSVDSSSLSSTWPGWDRQARGVEVGVSEGGSDVFVEVGSGVRVGGMCVRVGAGCEGDEQAKSTVKSARRTVFPIA
jgi:hypothetical protein